MAKLMVRSALALACMLSLPSALLADEVVHFTNGAEMPVHAHTVDQAMVKLDLGNNSFISFPMSMVDKIVNAGQDVFLNPTFHPANQAIAGSGFGSAGGAVGGAAGGDANSIHGSGTPVGFAPQANARGGNGTMLGEAADMPGQVNNPNQIDTDVSRRRQFNPSAQLPPGSFPQVIMPPGAKRPGQMTLMPPKPPPTNNPQPQAPPVPPGEQSGNVAGGGDDGGNN